MLGGWALVLGSVIFWLFFWMLFWHHPQSETSANTPSVTDSPASLFGHVVFTIFLGLFFLAAGGIGYFLVLMTCGFTFNFTRPIWPRLKVKIYLFNICIPLAVTMGVGFLLSSFFTPVLEGFGMPPEFAFMMPLMGAVGVGQLVNIWVLVWAPLEKRAINRRLSAIGITPAQMETGIYLGLSDPSHRSLAKRFAAIEEDIGMLWFAPEQLIYYGDTERLSITREQLVSVDRRVDGRSTTALSGTAHVILTVRLPDGTQRLIRLHTEGVTTMGGKRRAMNQLNERIMAWRGTPNLAQP
jgi:hypothetical protein